tara:strand:- start:1586 stop:1900 length:315 start_codon:yes stop_codon:yes gene_type:complete
VTAGVKQNAVRERCGELGIRIREYTIDHLRAKGYDIPDERSFYRSYIERVNRRTQDIINDLNESVRQLNDATDREIIEWNELYFAAYNRPRPEDWFWYSEAGYQ